MNCYKGYNGIEAKPKHTVKNTALWVKL